MSTISASTTTTTAYKVAADTTGTLVLKTGATPTTAMTIDGSQQVGIGATPLTALTFLAGSTISWGSSLGSIDYVQAGSGSLALGTNGTQKAVIDTSGNLGIGTSSPSEKLHVENGNARINRASNSSILTLGGSPSANWEGDIQFLTSNSQINWRVSSNRTVSGAFTITPSTATGGSTFTTPAMTLDASGNWMVGTSTPAASTRATVYANSGTAMFVQIYSIAPTLIQFANSQGNGGAITMAAGGATSYGTSSDYRLKDNIQPMTGALSRVARLNPVTYNWKVDGSEGESFIAHELAEVCPQAVHGEKDGTREEEYEITPAVKDEQGNVVTEAVKGIRTVPQYQNIDTSHLVALLTAAIKEQQALITQLQADVASLKG